MKFAGLYRILILGLATSLIGCGGGPAAPQNESSQLPSFDLSLLINAGAATTPSRNVSLSVTAQNATEMYITQDPSCNTGGTWVPYSSTASWSLKKFNRLNTVYAKVRNGTITSSCVYDHITHVAPGPYLTIESPLPNTYTTLVTQSAYMIQGYCSDPTSTIQITSPVTDTATCDSMGEYSATLDLTSVPEGSFSLNVSMTDSGNVTTTNSLNTLIKDTVAPTLGLTTPLTGESFNASEVSSVTFSGTCSEDTRNVVLSGAISDTIPCSSGTWSKAYNLTTLPEGSLQVKFDHQDAAGNSATQITANYTKDVTAPTLAILTPASGAYVNAANKSAYTISGTCSENGQSVTISGSLSRTVTCTSLTWTFNYNFTAIADGPLSITASTSDASGNTATTATRNFIKDTVAPTLTLSAPVSGDSFSTSEITGVSFSGTCSENTRTVVLTGAISDSVTCSAGGWNKTYDLSSLADGSFQVNFNHQDAAGNPATQVTATYTKDTSAPTLTITTPAAASYINAANQATYTLSGTCSENGRTVTISGSISTSATCTSSAWSVNYNFTSLADGALSITASISDVSGNTTTTAARNFTKDVTAPAAIAVTNPASSPYTTATSSITISGTCEGSSTLQVTGAETLSGTCASGTFSLNFSKPADGTYTYTIKQTDAAGNASAGTDFVWTVDMNIPATPVLTSPTPNPLATNLNSIVIAGSCVTGNTVTLSGEVNTTDVTSPVGLLTQTCASNTFSFTIQKTIDDTYTFYVDQTNLADVTSASVQVDWTRDTVTPAAVVLTNPITNPYTAGGSLNVTGTCETGTTVSVTGSNTASTTCIDGTFAMTLSQSTDGTYNYTFKQTDAASNASTTVAQQWVRDSSVLPAPVITNPNTASVTTKNTSITISGTCVTGYTVKIASGAIASDVSSPANSLTQICLGTFSFTINKSVDASYTFTFTQSDGVTTSPAVSQVWIRDTLPPNTTITLNPSNPNLKLSAIFNFTSSETNSTFECNFDSAGWSACVSPLTYSTVTNANHVLDIRAIDKAGNIDPSPASFSWTQNAYKTIALYHFTAGSDLIDSSLYTGAENNLLTDTGTTTLASGQFADGRTFASASSQYMSALDNNSLEVLNEKMTAEMWVKMASYPATNGQYAMLISKNGAAGQLGWEFAIKRVSGSYRPVFRGSLDGTVVTEKRATSACFTDTTTWHHVAFTWNLGTVTFYCDGVAKGSGIIGTAGTSKLFNSTATLRFGRTNTVSTTYQYLNGAVDEVRLSQVLRWTSGFTVPSSAYTSD